MGVNTFPSVQCPVLPVEQISLQLPQQIKLAPTYFINTVPLYLSQQCPLLFGVCICFPLFPTCKHLNFSTPPGFIFLLWDFFFLSFRVQHFIALNRSGFDLKVPPPLLTCPHDFCSVQLFFPVFFLVCVLSLVWKT